MGVSLVTQTINNLPTMQDTWDRSLDREDPLQKGMATHSSILALEVLMDRGACWATAHGVKELDTT